MKNFLSRIFKRNPRRPMDYKGTGVYVEEGKNFVKYINEILPISTGFAAPFKLPTGYENPVLVSGADGVGTKLRIANLVNSIPSHFCVGYDLVAMCVNDVITSGAKPLYFLDYIATGRLNQERMGHVIRGMWEGCQESEMELIGGETAEMPKMYKGEEYDLAGFCTGIVEENEIVDGKLIKPGDQIIGIQSSGLHSNGFSLINEMLWRHKIYLDETPELLYRTIIYAPVVKTLLDEVPVLGMAHITGGGIPENLPRCLPEGLTAHVDYNSWPLPEIFSKIMCAGEIVEEEMKNVFNLGIGYCLVVPSESVDDTQKVIDHHCLKSWVIGEVK